MPVITDLLPKFAEIHRRVLSQTSFHYSPDIFNEIYCTDAHKIGRPTELSEWWSTFKHVLSALLKVLSLASFSSTQESRESRNGVTTEITL